MGSVGVRVRGQWPKVSPRVGAHPRRGRRPARARGPWTADVAHLGPQQVLDLQRTAGNAAVAAMVVQPKEGPGRPTLRFGSSGQDVLELQSALNHTDEVVTPLAVDGAFGPITNKAVRQFQSAHPPLVTDGVVGPLTWGAIGVAGTETQDDTVVARKLFGRGAAAYSQGKFAHAYDEMTKSDELSHRVGVTFSRAQCLRRLGGRREEAIALYQQYLAESPAGSRTRQARFYASELRTQGAAP